jgi:hypothetical protein
MVHQASEGDVQQAVQAIDELETTTEPTVKIRILIEDA